MSLLKLPTELLRLIATTLSDRYLSRLVQVNSHLYNLLLSYLYQRRPKPGYYVCGWPTSFIRAIATENERGTRNFLYYGADVNVICGHLFLYAEKVPFSPWFDMQTPLNVAASIGNDTLVRMLLDHGAEINGVVQENWGPSRERTQPAVVDALLSGHESTVRLLLERGSDIQGPHMEAGGLVSCAVQTGQLAILKLLVEFGADVSIPYKGVYPLWRAVCSTQLSTDIVRFLLDHGAEIAPIDDGRERIMKQVMNRGTIDTAQLLVERGAIYPPDEFHLAVEDGSLDFVRLLIECGMKPDIELLKRTIRNQRFKMLQLLLEVGFDLNSRDSRGSTILHHAVTRCGFEWPTGGMGGGIICRKPAPRRLVRDVKVLRPQNLSAPCRKQEIIRDDAEETLRYLIDIGADVNAMDGQGHTPLYLAQKSYYASAAEQILLDNGAISERGVL